MLLQQMMESAIIGILLNASGMELKDVGIKLKLVLTSKEQ